MTRSYAANDGIWWDQPPGASMAPLASKRATLPQPRPAGQIGGIVAEAALTRSLHDVMSAEPMIERLATGAAREPYVPLLLLADEPEPLHGYLNDGDLYVLRESDGEPLGAALVLPLDKPGVVELKAVAVSASQHNRGLGQRMLRGVLDDLRSRGVARVVVGTSNAGIGQIAFYKKAGFRLWRIERDYFTPDKGYDPDERENGLPHRDMVWFDQTLG
jgi:GNAT superfamily N-acetyltransferase